MHILLIAWKLLFTRLVNTLHRVEVIMLALRSAAAWYSRALDTSPVLARIFGTVPILVAADAVSQASEDQPWNWRKYELTSRSMNFDTFNCFIWS